MASRQNDICSDDTQFAPTFETGSSSRERAPVTDYADGHRAVMRPGNHGSIVNLDEMTPEGGGRCVTE